MGRKRKSGRDVSGWLVIDKPLGLGSTTLVSKARWAFGARSAGHAGTLDPLATGVLAIALGRATKCVPYVMDGAKRYRFTIAWGAETTTDDLEGAVSRQSDQRPTPAEIDAILTQFRGDIMQIPPAFSAVKVDGARAYDLARDGKEVALAARPLHVDHLATVATDTASATFEMTCGKGGYVRSIARDIGRALGCLGHVTALRRLATGPFELSDALAAQTLDGLRDDPARDAVLIPVERALAAVTEIAVGDDEKCDLQHGRKIRSAQPDGEAWASHDGRALALGRVESGTFAPSRILIPLEHTD